MTNLDQTLLERAVRYGSFIDVANRTNQIYHAIYCNAPEFNNKSAKPYHAQALHMIAYKIARLVNGQINDADSWQDIAGYALLVHNHIAQQQDAKATKPAFADKAIIDAMEHEIAQDMKEA